MMKKWLSSILWKKWQKIIWGLYPNHMHIFRPWKKTSVKFQKNQHKTVGGVAHTRYPLSIHFDCKNAWKMAKLNLWKKWQKKILGLYPKPHAYLQTMNKTPIKFWKNRHKTVGGVAHTRYPLFILFDRKNAEKMTKFNLWKKVIKKNLRTISKPHAYLQTMTKTSVKFRKNPHKTVGGVAHTRYLLSIHFDSKNAEKND